MTNHALARLLLSAPDAPAEALFEDHGSLYWVGLTAHVVTEDDIEYMGLETAKPGMAVIEQTGEVTSDA